MLDMRQLAALSALAHSGSIAAAARELHWSQPTVTHHLKSLARALDAPVVVSDASGTRLTLAGETLLPTAQEILSLARRAEREVSLARGTPRGTSPLSNSVDPLRVGVIPSIGASVMPPLLRHFANSGARITVSEAETSRLIGDLASMTIDIAILLGGATITPLLPAGTLYQPLLRERLVLLVPRDHRLSRGSGVSMLDVANEKWVLSPSENDPEDALLRDEARSCDIEVSGSVFSDDYGVIQGYVAAGLGLALVPESVVSRDRNDISTATLAGERFVREVGVAVAPHAPRPLVEPFLEELMSTHGGTRP